MQITYTNEQGQIQHAELNLTADQLQGLLADYQQPAQGRYRRIMLANFNDHPKLKAESIYYPSAPTGTVIEFGYHHIGNYDSREACYRETYKSERAIARYVVQIANYMKQHYFKKGYTVFVGSSRFQESYKFIAIGENNLAEVRSVLDDRIGSTCDVYFVPNEQAQEYLEMERIGLTYLDTFRKFPYMSLQLSSDETHTIADIEAVKTFRNVLVVDRDFGILPKQRLFITELKNGSSGVLASSAVDGKGLAYIKKYYANNFDGGIKSLKEIDQIEFARVQKGAKFIVSMA